MTVAKHSLQTDDSKHGCFNVAEWINFIITELQLSGNADNPNIKKRNQNLKNPTNRTACIRHLCRITTVLSCHRCVINTSVEKMNNI